MNHTPQPAAAKPPTMLFALLLILLLLAACTPTSEPSLSPEQDDEPTNTVEPSATPSPEPDTPEPSATPQPVDEEAEVVPSPSATFPSREELRLTPEGTPDIERVPAEEEPAPVIGEMPAGLLDQIMADMAKRSGKPAANAKITRAEATIWNDGSLGCPQPGEMYTQALVPGYWIVLEVDGEVYDYRTSETTFRLCPGGLPLDPPAGGTPTS